MSSQMFRRFRLKTRLVALEAARKTYPAARKKGPVVLACTGAREGGTRTFRPPFSLGRFWLIEGVALPPDPILGPKKPTGSSLPISSQARPFASGSPAYFSLASANGPRWSRWRAADSALREV